MLSPSTPSIHRRAWCSIMFAAVSIPNNTCSHQIIPLGSLSFLFYPCFTAFRTVTKAWRDAPAFMHGEISRVPYEEQSLLYHRHFCNTARFSHEATFQPK